MPLMTGGLIVKRKFLLLATPLTSTWTGTGSVDAAALGTIATI
jgi:hypothetical protein